MSDIIISHTCERSKQQSLASGIQYMYSRLMASERYNQQSHFLVVHSHIKQIFSAKIFNIACKFRENLEWFRYEYTVQLYIRNNINSVKAIIHYNFTSPDNYIIKS